MSEPAPIYAVKVGRVTEAEKVTIAQLRAEHRTVHEIAALLRRSPDAVRATIVEAQTMLASAAQDVAYDWVEASRIAARKGNHRPAKELLEAVGAIETHRESGGPQVVVQMGFALPGVPQGPSGAIPVKASD